MGDIDKAEYLGERQMLQARLAKVTVAQAKPDYLSRMAQFLQDLSLAWEAGEQQQRKRLVTEVFEAVWVKDALILGVTPKPDMMPFFDMVHGEASTISQTGGPDGEPTLTCNLITPYLS
ncbi:MAG: hypothetical protein KJ624_08560 [Chloroflexi bacterium]|nr:hypothetical protein [Chloroflexota bacterium]